MSPWIREGEDIWGKWREIALRSGERGFDSIQRLVFTRRDGCPAKQTAARRRDRVDFFYEGFLEFVGIVCWERRYQGFGVRFPCVKHFGRGLFFEPFLKQLPCWALFRERLSSRERVYGAFFRFLKHTICPGNGNQRKHSQRGKRLRRNTYFENRFKDFLVLDPRNARKLANKISVIFFDPQFLQ